jgi:hypothetical protein
VAATSPDATAASASASSSSTVAATGTVQLLMSDGSSEDWATVGVKVQAIALTPQGGGSPVVVYSSATPLALNLAQLDQLGELLGSVAIPAGTYAGATLTLGGNPGDVSLTAAADPEPGFAGTAGAAVPASQIQIQNTLGTAPNLTVPISVTFDTALVVTAGQNHVLQLEVDLSHPAFIVAHVPPTGGGTTIWAVNFNGPVHRVPVADPSKVVLRQIYGNISAVAVSNASITITKVLPTLPAVNQETSVATAQSLQLLTDATNGTLFYDLDAKTSSTIKNFSSVSAGLTGKFIRATVRYQPDGTLVAVRVWVSATFNKLWISPEGHVLHVDTTHNVINVQTEDGSNSSLTINANTRFYFRAPANALADATPIATGTAFLSSGNLVRGFKVHASVVDPLANPLVADSIDIETAVYDSKISAAGATGFTMSHAFSTTGDNYSHTLGYIASTTANGKDAKGNAISGFKWWDEAFPTLLNSGSTAISGFQSAAGSSINFGGTVGILSAYGATYAVWGDPANASGWSAPWVVLSPIPVPLGIVATGVVNGGFAMSVPGGTKSVAINLSTTVGSATLVYQVDRTAGVVTVNPVDITTSTGLTNLTSHLVVGVPVKVSGAPNPDGSLRAYVITYYTGTTSNAK